MMHLLNMLVAKLIMLQVQWDESSSVFRPERVSPWELEPIVANSMRSSHPPPQRNKRPRPPGLPSPTTAPSTPGILFFFFSFVLFLLVAAPPRFIDALFSYCRWSVEIPGSQSLLGAVVLSFCKWWEQIIWSIHWISLLAHTCG